MNGDKFERKFKMKNWIIVLLIFVIPLGLWGYLDNTAKADSGTIAQNIAALDSKTMMNTQKPLPTLYKFSSPMCGDCKKVAKEIEPLRAKWEDKVIFKEYNVSGSEGESPTVQSLLSKYKITVVPTLLFVDSNGKLVKKTEGYISQSNIETNLKALTEGK